MSKYYWVNASKKLPEPRIDKPSISRTVMVTNGVMIFMTEYYYARNCWNINVGTTHWRDLPKLPNKKNHNKSKNAYEKYLNQFYSEMVSSDVFDKFIYFTNRNRTISLSEKLLWNWIYKNKIGTLVHKYDSIAFNVGYNEWNP